MDTVDNILSNLPTNFFQSIGDNHLYGMAQFSTIVGAVNSVSKGDPTKNKKADIPQSELDKFGNWTGQTDTKVMAKDLMNRGLQGANQLLYDMVDTSTGDSIKNAQSDWKVAAIQQILSNAKKFNLRTPEEINANRNVLIGNSRWVDAINNQSFKTIHPNFWSVITDSLLPEQYAKYDKNNSQTVSK